MRYLLILFFLALNFISLAQSKWEKAYDENDLLIHTRTTSDDLFEFKASTVYNHSVKKILAAIRDYESYPKWNYKTKEFRIIERLNEDEHYSYSIVDFPFPMKDRDVVMFSSTSYPSDNSILIKMRTEPSKMKKTDYVRMSKIRGFWKLIPLSTNKTKVVYQIASETNGMPYWLIEMFALEAPKGNLRGLKKIVEEKEG
ncbi:MAG: START domain-containing protein [Bacteroidota bacterium]